jgi:hypothetical protein
MGPRQSGGYRTCPAIAMPSSAQFSGCATIGECRQFRASEFDGAIFDRFGNTTDISTVSSCYRPNWPLNYASTDGDRQWSGVFPGGSSSMSALHLRPRPFLVGGLGPRRNKKAARSGAESALEIYFRRQTNCAKYWRTTDFTAKHCRGTVDLWNPLWHSPRGAASGELSRCHILATRRANELFDGSGESRCS